KICKRKWEIFQDILRMHRLNNNQVLGAGGDVLAAILGEDGHVLNPDTEFAGQVNAGFGRADGTGGHGVGVAGVDVGSLVDFQTQAVAISVAEVLTVTGIGDDFPGNGVNVLAGDAGLGGGDGSFLSLQHGVVDGFHFLGGKAHGHGPGHIGAVAHVGSAEVHG